MKHNAFFCLLLLVAAVVVSPASSAAPSHLFASADRMAEWNSWRFGMFIHWGPWSQTADGVLWQIVYRPNRTPETMARDFALCRTFDPQKFDARNWARIAKEAGMKYVVFVTKHHDGFNNYDTKLSPFRITAPDVPFHQDPRADVTREIVEAFRQEGLAVGFYFSHIDWHHADGKYFSIAHPDYDPDMIDREPERWERFAAYEIGQVRELLSNYGKIDIVWFDIWWPRLDHPRVKRAVEKLVTTMHRLQPDLIVNDRGIPPHGNFTTPEQFVPDHAISGNWETNMTITNGRGFWYKGPHAETKPPRELLQRLVEVASKGGNFLLNIGPSGEGELLRGEIDALRALGAWLRVNGESIHGTQKSVFRALPHGFSTTRGNTIYLHVFDAPADGRLPLPGLQNDVTRAYLLSDPGRAPLHVAREEHGTVVRISTSPDGETLATVIAVELDGPPHVDNRIRQQRNGSIFLHSRDARLHGQKLRYQGRFNVHGTHGEYLQGFIAPADVATWEFVVTTPGSYSVNVSYGAGAGDPASEFKIEVGDNSVGKLISKPTTNESWQEGVDVNWQKAQKHDALIKTVAVGEVAFARPGSQHLRLVAVKPAAPAYIRSVTLRPVAQPIR